MPEPIIKVNNLEKVFRLPHERQSSLKSTIINFRRRGYELQRALDGVSFEIQKGEFFGIVGRNGSGKSTLLKLLAGIYTPTKGDIKINGSLTPFIELGVGFNQELSGRENVFLNGALLGFNRKQMHAMYDEIVAFAELERFMDQKLKNYSSGMQVRLAFSIAIRAEGDILLLDEVLAVGDGAFQRKCLDFFREVKKTDRTVVLVTHNMATIEEYCDRAMMLEDSKVLSIGNPRDIALQYEIANLSGGIDSKEAEKSRPRNPAIKIVKLTARPSATGSNEYELNEDVMIDVEIDVKRPQPIQVQLGVIATNNNEYVAGINTIQDLKDFVPKAGRHKLTCKLDAGQFIKGVYRTYAVVYSNDDELPKLIDAIGADDTSAAPLIIFIGQSPSKNGKFLVRGGWTA